ncbi:MAG TPA: hypothetical protein VIK95_10395 [Egibacteraceae bacterium]
MTLKGISVADARAWASYVRALRAEINQRKEAGELPDTLAAPELMHRLLVEVLTAIDELPPRRTATLRLPGGRALLVFAWYQSSVQEWADKRVAEGLLTTTRSEAADRFWTRIEQVSGLPVRRSAEAS